MNVGRKPRPGEQGGGSPYPPVVDVDICGRLRGPSELVAVAWWLLDGESTPDVDGRSSSAMTSAALRRMPTMRGAGLAWSGRATSYVDPVLVVAHAAAMGRLQREYERPAVA